MTTLLLPLALFCLHLPETRHLPMSFNIDASAATNPGSVFRFLDANKVAVEVEWDGQRYLVKQAKP